jgi:NAD(P)-dependent dehydrogenase (short-subunit alcohol dehydrogenase family)
MAGRTIFDQAEQALGDVTALVLCHCESVDSGLLDTSIESFDRHFAVNARASWLLIREYAGWVRRWRRLTSWTSCARRRVSGSTASCS